MTARPFIIYDAACWRISIYEVGADEKEALVIVLLVADKAR